MSERVHVEKDEEYPVYLVTDQVVYAERTVEVPDGFAERYAAARAEWMAVQSVLHVAWEQAS